MAERLGDARVVASCLDLLAHAHVNLGELANARPYLDRALVLHESLGNYAALQRDLGVLGIVCNDAGQYAQAVRANTFETPGEK